MKLLIRRRPVSRLNPLRDSRVADWLLPSLFRFVNNLTCATAGCSGNPPRRTRSCVYCSRPTWTAMPHRTTSVPVYQSVSGISALAWIFEALQPPFQTFLLQHRTKLHRHRLMQPLSEVSHHTTLCIPSGKVTIFKTSKLQAFVLISCIFLRQLFSLDTT